MLPPFVPTLDRLRSLCTTSLLLVAGVPLADLRRTAGMCPELLSVPLETITVALRFLTEEAGVPAGDLPRVLRWCTCLLVSPVVARLRPTLCRMHSGGGGDRESPSLYEFPPPP